MNEHQAALLRKARESQKAARLLAERGWFDFAVSRAYYAMFYVAQAFLAGEGLEFSKHSAVISAFGSRFSKTGKVPAEFHRHLIEGEHARLKGDYDALSEGSAETAARHIARAEQFLELAEQMLGPLPSELGRGG